MSFAPEIDSLPEHVINSGFLLFASFHVHKSRVLPTCFKNIMTGLLDRFDIFLSDFTSACGIDDSAADCRQTIVVLRSSRLRLQKFYLMPESAARFTVRLDHIGHDRIMPLLRGYRKIPFQGFPELKSIYALKSPVRPFSEQILSVAFMEYLSGHPGWFIEGDNDALLVYRRGKRIRPADIPGFIGDAVAIGRLLEVKSG